MKMGVIRESSSPYASPVVVVKIKDNTNRVCVDYQKLNKLTVFDPEPIGHYRNVRGLGKSMVVFRLFEKLRYSNERSTIF